MGLAALQKSAQREKNMKFHSMVWIAIGLIMIFAAALTGQQPVLAQSAETSCINCHETQAKNPVRTVGQWHIQHNTLACEICHAGSPAAETQEAALAVLLAPQGSDPDEVEVLPPDCWDC